MPVNKYLGDNLCHLTNQPTIDIVFCRELYFPAKCQRNIIEKGDKMCLLLTVAYTQEIYPPRRN